MASDCEAAARHFLLWSYSLCGILRSAQTGGEGHGEKAVCISEMVGNACYILSCETSLEFRSI